MLKDSTYQKYSGLDPNAPLPGDATPDYVFSVLASAQASSIKTFLNGGNTVESAATALTSDQEKSVFAMFDTIEFDATGRCKLDQTLQGDSKLRCDRVYIPKGVKSVLVSVRWRGNIGSLTVYKNGSAVQSIPRPEVSYVSTGAETTGTSYVIIETTGSGNEYIQIYVTARSTRSIASTMSCQRLAVEAISI